MMNNSFVGFTNYKVLPTFEKDYSEKERKIEVDHVDRCKKLPSHQLYHDEMSFQTLDHIQQGSAQCLPCTFQHQPSIK